MNMSACNSVVMQASDVELLLGMLATLRYEYYRCNYISKDRVLRSSSSDILAPVSILRCALKLNSEELVERCRH